MHSEKIRAEKVVYVVLQCTNDGLRSPERYTFAAFGTKKAANRFMTTLKCPPDSWWELEECAYEE
jgi:hypothetical protein